MKNFSLRSAVLGASIAALILITGYTFAYHGFARPYGAANGSGIYGFRGQAYGRMQSPIQKFAADSSATTSVSDQVRGDLLFIYEEEKMARDLYASFGEKWGWQTIGRVSMSESMHLNSVMNLLHTYGIPEPVLPTGSYQSAAISELAKRLLNEGIASEDAALHSALYVEEYDIADLTKRMNDTADPSILSTYQYLLNGSNAHLRYFYSLLVENGGTYTPQVLSQQAFDAALASQGGVGPMMGGYGGGRGGMMRWY